MSAKIPAMLPHAQATSRRALILKSVTPVPQFFKNISEAVETTRSLFQASSTNISIDYVQNGFLLYLDSFIDFREACARLWGLDVTAQTGMREYGLWDIEVLKNENNEDLSHLIRSVYSFCENIVTRKKSEACKSESD